eukprot:SAG22_NODE_2430_length_2580_cov_2.118098_2_plen_217_part_00
MYTAVIFMVQIILDRPRPPARDARAVHLTASAGGLDRDGAMSCCGGKPAAEAASTAKSSEKQPEATATAAATLFGGGGGGQPKGAPAAAGPKGVPPPPLVEEPKGVPPLVAAARRLVSSAAAAAGQPAADDEQLVEKVYVMLRSATNQAYATGLSGGGKQNGLGSRQHADQLLELLLQALAPTATLGQQEEVRIEVRSCLGGLRNKAYAGGLGRAG